MLERRIRQKVMAKILLALGAAVMVLLVLLLMPETARAADNIDRTGWTEVTASTGGTNLSNGNYYLNADVSVSSTITVTGSEVTLDLNGHVLKYDNSSAKGSVIRVTSGGASELAGQRSILFS